MALATETLLVEAPDPATTEAFGRRLGEALFPGAVVALIGPLGAGKTQLVRAVAEGLNIPDSRVVSSPTFVLIHEYAARLPIYHFDAYRLSGPGELFDLGVWREVGKQKVTPAIALAMKRDDGFGVASAAVSG